MRSPSVSAQVQENLQPSAKRSRRSASLTLQTRGGNKVHPRHSRGKMLARQVLWAVRATPLMPMWQEVPQGPCPYLPTQSALAPFPLNLRVPSGLIQSPAVKTQSNKTGAVGTACIHTKFPDHTQRQLRPRFEPQLHNSLSEPEHLLSAEYRPSTDTQTNWIL